MRSKPSWLPICINGCTKRFHVGRIPLRMPHRPHTLSKLLDKCRIRCGIRQLWHYVAERRQDEPVSRRGKDCFGDVFDSEVLLQPRVYGRKIVMRHGHQRPKNDRSIRSNEIGSRTDNKVESWQLRREYVSHRHPEVLHHCGIHDRAVKKRPNCGSRCCHRLFQLRNTVCLTSVLFRDSLRPTICFDTTNRQGRLMGDKGTRYLSPRIAAIGMLSFISRRASGQGSRRRLRLRSCDQYRIRTSAPYRGRF